MAKKINKRSGDNILGVFIDTIDWQQALTKLISWGISREPKYVCQCNVDVVVKTTQNEYYRNIINNSDLANPDGMPIVWALRQKGFEDQERIGGPDLMLEICRLSEQKNIPVFFYGSTFETLVKLKSKLKREFKDLEIAGIYSPPFHQLSVEDNNEIIKLLSSSGAGIIFVGLGCPKQEIWMFQNRNKIKAVLIGVGAAFDFYSGNIERAPFWMQKIGLEWLFRLVKEPNRLWKRYLYGNTIFTIKILFDIYNIKLRRKIFDLG